MSEPRVAALVCEGQTDVPLFRSVIQELWPSIELVLSLQPELDETGRARGRAGWSEVKSWCEQHAGDLDEVLEPLVGDSIDLLLVAIDMDVALAAGIADPPRKPDGYETKRLRATMERWLTHRKGQRSLDRVVLSTPVMAIEAWVIAALFRQQKAPEKLATPAGFLLRRKKLRPSPKDSKPWKELHVYQDFAERIARALPRVRKACPEAERTCRGIEQRRDAVE